MAAENEQKDYGKRIEYDPLWKGPIEEKRIRTDSKFLLVFLVFMLIWIATSIYAFVVGNPSIFVDQLEQQSNKDDEFLSPKVFAQAAKISIGFTIFAGVLSIVYIILLRWYAKVMAYTTIVVISLIFLFLGIANCIIFSANRGRGDALAIATICLIMLVVVIGCAIYFRKKINIACEIIREASKAVMFFPSSLAFPVLPYLLYTITSIYTITVCFNLLSIVNKINGQFETPAHVYFLHFINVFGCFWLCGFITGFAQMTLSGSFATWYWTLHKAYVPKFTILHCMNTTARYHLGTIAFGSLIIAICELINLLLSYIRSKLQNNGNAFTCFCFGWYSYLFQHLERFVKFMSRGAYVMSSMHGTDFIQSTKDAFNLFMRNILKVIVANEVTDGVLALGSLIAIGLSVLATWGYCSSQNLNNEIPVALATVTFFSTLISVAFFMVLKTAVDTIFLCVLEDYERNDGSEEKPYYMTLEIQSLLFKEQSESV